jgi:hypothetical protein
VIPCGTPASSMYSRADVLQAVRLTVVCTSCGDCSGSVRGLPSSGAPPTTSLLDTTTSTLHVLAIVEPTDTRRSRAEIERRRAARRDSIPIVVAMAAAVAAFAVTLTDPKDGAPVLETMT